MKLEDGKILNSEIKKNIDAEIATQLFQVELAEEGDAETIEELHIPSFQYRPEDGARGFVGWITRQWRAFLSINDQVTKLVINKGECVVYSVSGGVIKAKAHFKNDGSIDIEAAAGLNITGPVNITGDVDITGNTTVDGTIDATGIIHSDIDVTGPNISLESHLHLGELGGTVGTPTTASVSTPNPATPGVGIDVGSNELTANGKNLSTHTHAQANDAGGNAEQETNAPT